MAARYRGVRTVEYDGKRVAEQFARLCLLASIDWAAQNSSSDDPKQLSQ
jgi:hypothetical protein